jgi:predicted Zn-ribbon and HTH transcriptional regulator
MSKTIELTNGRIADTNRELTLLDEAELPGVSTIRLSRSMTEIQDQMQEVKSSLDKIKRNHLKNDEEGDPVVEVLLPNDKSLGETAVVETTGPRGQKQISEYKDIDLDDVDWSEYGVDPDDYHGREYPPTQERYVYDDQEAMIEERKKLLQDSVEIEIHEFPEEEFEDVIYAFKNQRAKQQADKIVNILGLDDKEDAAEIQKIREVLGEVNRDSRLKPSEIKSVAFLFPEDL